AIPGVVFSGSVDGHLRGYSTANGDIIWDFDTVRDYETINDVPAKGGSMNVGGPAIAGGEIFVNSGYVQNGIPGNVLLAFRWTGSKDLNAIVSGYPIGPEAWLPASIKGPQCFCEEPGSVGSNTPLVRP